MPTKPTSETKKWFWKMKWCEDIGISPKDGWEAAEQAYQMKKPTSDNPPRHTYMVWSKAKGNVYFSSNSPDKAYRLAEDYYYACRLNGIPAKQPECLR